MTLTEVRKRNSELVEQRYEIVQALNLMAGKKAVEQALTDRISDIDDEIDSLYDMESEILGYPAFMSECEDPSWLKFIGQKKQKGAAL